MLWPGVRRHVAPFDWLYTPNTHANHPRWSTNSTKPAKQQRTLAARVVWCVVVFAVRDDGPARFSTLRLAINGKVAASFTLPRSPMSLAAVVGEDPRDSG